MYWKWVICISAALTLGSAAACEFAPEQTSDVSSSPAAATSSYSSSDAGQGEMELYSVPVDAPVTAQPASNDSNSSPNPGGVGISASIFL